MKHDLDITIQPSVGEIVANDYRKAEVFKKYGIDFCCGGKNTIEYVCEKKGINQAELEIELETVNNLSQQPTHDFKSWSLPFLIDYIINVHHTYVTNKVGFIHQYAQKVARVHGHAAPENVEIANLLAALKKELLWHMQKEEKILFPYIKRMQIAFDNQQSITSPPFGTAQNPINMMEHEHENAGTIMAKIRELSNDFTPPDWACNTYKVLYSYLNEFESDLHQHVHLENNILFPKAIELERKL